jgi:hypothetical protein
MKTKVNVEELERTIDFEAVVKKLLGLAESGGFRRRKTVATLLDKARDALLKVRDSGASIAALSTFCGRAASPIHETSRCRGANQGDRCRCTAACDVTRDAGKSGASAATSARRNWRREHGAFMMPCQLLNEARLVESGCRVAGIFRGKALRSHKKKETSPPATPPSNLSRMRSA